jgi:ATP-dependent RNA helicase RhlE
LVVKLGLKCNIRAEALHAGRDATSRHDALTAFRNGDVTVLVATDVASRGLDVPDVS